MKFMLIDRITALEPGKSISTTKSLSLAEEYLADHFPSFPVIPGVLMLEAMVQSAAWLIRVEQDFANSIIVLKEAKNVKYAYFLRPGSTMQFEVKLLKIQEDSAVFKGTGHADGILAVSGRFELAWRNMAEKGQYGERIDRQLETDFRKDFELLGGVDLPVSIETINSGKR
jgi:3-hydroxyacyl-[acyl-carrier-protein] dehydratase